MCHNEFITGFDPTCVTDVYVTSWFIFRRTFIPSILRPYANVDTDANAEPNANASTIFDGDTNTIINTSINPDTDVFGFCDII
ncbi:hypothetical protein J1N35_038672, partial [Gossypium stocksii]